MTGHRNGDHKYKANFSSWRDYSAVSPCVNDYSLRINTVKVSLTVNHSPGPNMG
jgi:hypothetical protein